MDIETQLKNHRYIKRTVQFHPLVVWFTLHNSNYLTTKSYLTYYPFKSFVLVISPGGLEQSRVNTSILTVGRL